MNINRKPIEQTVEETDYLFISKSETLRRFSFSNILTFLKSKLLANNTSTTTAGQYALDARQGKTLADLIATNTESINQLNSKTLYRAINVLSQLSASSYITPTGGSLYMFGNRVALLYITATVKTAMTAGTQYDLMVLPTKLRPATFTGCSTPDYNAAILGTGGTVRFKPLINYAVNATLYFTCTYILSAEYS